MRRYGLYARLASLTVLALAGLGIGCAAPSVATTGPEAGPVRCSQVAVTPQGPDEAPDFTGYGFPQVVAAQRFVPGQASTLSADSIVVTLPADLYTEPLDFELLVNDPDVWQTCVPADQIVVAPYAYRVREVASGKPVGRFDKAATAAITDQRVTAAAKYWVTTAGSPPTADPSTSSVSITGTVLKVDNPTARRGWFVTVSRS